MLNAITKKVRFPRLGTIRLGEKKVNPQGKEYPAKLDHFNLVDAPAVATIFAPNGEEVRSLAPVLFPGNPVKTEDGWDFSGFWKTSRSAYGKGTGLFCRCDDGETAFRVHKGNLDNGKPADPQGLAFIKGQGIQVDVGEIFAMPCPEEDPNDEEGCPYWTAKRCKNLGILDLMLPSVPGFGTWCIKTSSFNSLRNVESFLVTLANATGGVVAGIPIILNLIEHQGQVDGRAVTVYVLNPVCPYNLAQLAGLRRKAISAGGAVIAAIEAPDEVPDDLFAQGGAALDADLSTGTPGNPTKQGAVGNLNDLTARMQQRRAVEAPAPPQAAPAADPEGQYEGDDRIEALEFSDDSIRAQADDERPFAPSRPGDGQGRKPAAAQPAQAAPAAPQSKLPGFGRF